jgi:hypothetical protein
MKRCCAIRSLFLVRKTQEFADDFGGAARVNGRNSTPVDERDTIGRSFCWASSAGCAEARTSPVPRIKPAQIAESAAA